ncbi:hypothetical protein HZ992_12485 [Rhizobacter sp. AJA081-3]|uniref:hypothetical protein n=1 Tax=Rhizobacter sp. AJA081-3 TaxID=2753607 RepID=UPI001ADF1F83|nr:hypothetical protein [Rhizobacter sp. AJA081-3]QTN25713.1 hypothetical protein HZ992_12485 [Rhizobacter sp. AJA081-3]
MPRKTCGHRRRRGLLARWTQAIRALFLPARVRHLTRYEWDVISVGLTRLLNHHPQSRAVWRHLAWLERTLPRGVRRLAFEDPRRLARAARELDLVLTPRTILAPWMLSDVIDAILDWQHRHGMHRRAATPARPAANRARGASPRSDGDAIEVREVPFAQYEQAELERRAAVASRR